MRIETSTKCHCGSFIETCLSIRGGWYASCPRCIDPEGDSVFERIQGFGPTPGDALFAWESKHDEVLEDEGYPVSSTLVELARQVSEERERQRGWAGVLRTHEGQVCSRDIEKLLECSGQFGARITYGPEAA